MDLEDRITIATPEGVTVELTLAGIGSRVLAAVIDSLIQLVILVALMIIVFAAGPDIGDTGASPDSPADFRGFVFVLLAVFNLFAFLLLFFYYVFFETFWSGRSPGKRAAGLRVVRATGSPVGLRASLVRNLVRIIDVLPTAYLIGIVSVLATKRNQRLGDLVAGTVVIREPRRSGATGPPVPELPPGVVESLRSWDVSAVTATDTAAVRSFLMRRASLKSPAREQIAQELAGGLGAKVVGAPPHLGAEDFLERLVVAKAQRD